MFEKIFRGIVFILLILAFSVMILNVATAKGRRGLGNHNLHPESTYVYIQEEFNYYNVTNIYNSDGALSPTNTLYNNFTIGYYNVEGWNIEAAIYNTPLVGGSVQNYQNDSYINISKSTKLSPDFNLDIGTSNGSSPDTISKWHNSDYISLGYKVNKTNKIRIGSYFVNAALSTKVDTFGYTAGIDMILMDVFTLQNDFVSGENNLSGLSTILWYKQVYLGVLTPTINSGNYTAGVIGFKYNFY